MTWYSDESNSLIRRLTSENSLAKKYATRWEQMTYDWYMPLGKVIGAVTGFIEPVGQRACSLSELSFEFFTCARV